MKPGDEVQIWITGRVGKLTAVVVQVDPVRLRVIGDDKWPLLKDEDFILAPTP